MPKSKTQGIIFGIIMSYAMAYGMEVYNIAIREGINLTAGKDCPLAVKRGNLTGTVLVFQRGPGNAGHDVKDMCYGFSVIPQIFIFSKCPYCVGL